MCFEVSRRNRPADIEWVRKEVKKHESLPTNQLVLVSRAGFTKTASKLAELNGAIPVTPETLTDPNVEYQIVTTIDSIWPKLVALTPRQVAFVVERPDGSAAWFRAATDQLLVHDDGQAAANPGHLVQRLVQLHFNDIVARIEAEDITEDIDDGDFTFEIDDPGQEVTHTGTPLYVRWEPEDGSYELHRITKMVVAGDMVVHVGEAKLRHARLGDTPASYGETKLAGRDVLVVVTEGAGGPKATLRIRPLQPPKG